MRPLDWVPSIKLKLGLAIVISVGISAAMSVIGLQIGLALWLRPLLATLIALAIVAVLSHGMTSPLREMRRAAQAMAAGDLNQRVTATSADEVGDLARAFNAMARDLQDVDRQRRDLVANVSHELRTPLAALQGNLENMVDGVAEPDVASLESMLRQTERLSRLVAQLLDLSRLEAGAAPLHLASVDLAGVVQRAEEDVRLALPGTRIELSVAGSVRTIDGDAERLQQVVRNLMENAARYEPAGSSIEVRLLSADNGVVLEVEDHGPGIPADEVDQVFDRFYRADTSASGAGLGLAIVRWIVDLHGGRVSVRTGPELGCCMVVALPTAAPQPPSVGDSPTVRPVEGVR